MSIWSILLARQYWLPALCNLQYEKQSLYLEVMAVIASLSKVNENLSAHCAISEDAETEGKGSKKSRKSG